VGSKPYYSWVVAFVSGMAIMGVEMSASRLMAPYFGTSLTIWTAIIGSTMVALTLGYYLGGILAEKHPSMSLLGTLLSFAALLVIFLPYIIEIFVTTTLGQCVQEAGAADRGASPLVLLVFSSILISTPVIVLGITSPFLICLISLHSRSVGRISGGVFAFSTLGSIIGTFLPAFFLVPTLGTRFSFLFFGVLLLGVSMWPLRRSGLVLISLIGFFAAVLAFIMGIHGRKGGSLEYLVEERETNYQLVRIVRAPLSTDGPADPQHMTALLTDAGFGMQSMWVENRPYTNSWQDFWILIPRVYEVCGNGYGPKQMLLIGLGAGCIPYLVFQLYPETLIDGVEIDGGLVEAATPYFPLRSLKNLNIHISDGRFFLRSTSKKYEVILIDAFRPPHIPPHLATAEFFEQIKQRLNLNGVMGMNVATRGEKLVFQAIANTVASVFPYVYYAQYYSPHEPSPVYSNRFIMASTKDLSLEGAEVEERVFSLSHPQWRDILETMREQHGFERLQRTYFRRFSFDPAAPVFTDDLSALETMSEREFLGIFKHTGK